MATNKEIPKNADKILFAEDLVSYIVPRHTVGYDELPCTANSYREFVYNGFTKTMEAAVDGIIGEEIFSMKYRMPLCCDGIYRIGYPPEGSTFMMFAKKHREFHFPSEFKICNVLPYCANLAILAANCCTRGDVEAPSLAVRCIVETFEDFGVTNDGWDSLNESAELYAAPLCTNVARETLND